VNLFGSGLAYRLSRRVALWMSLVWLICVMAVAWFYNTPIAYLGNKVAFTVPEHPHASIYWLLLPMLIIWPLLAALVYRVAHDELNAVEHIGNEILARNGSNLTPIELLCPSLEMNKIAIGVNHLLARLDDALHSERALAANAAHELRTPLAAAKLSLSTAKSYEMADEAKEALVELTNSLDILGKRAEKLLQLSRAEASSTLSQDRVDLAVLSLMVTQEFMNNPHAQSRLKLELPQDQAVMALGNFDAIAIALRNLIENALKYAPESLVHVKVESPASISVRDEGAGVAAADMGKLRLRHVRLSSNQAGYGLGLSIVRTIVEKNGGHLELHSPPDGHPAGFEAILKFTHFA
jgi:two-component system, OmpR family, sensor kinase